jgi:DMSO/TMAO reductase YedYZ heme-binding membrane subunit
MTGTVGHGTTALWYLTRSTGLVSFILLSATVVLGIVSSVGWTTQRWPRFLSQAVHRNLSLFCLALIGVHVVSTVADGYVPINLSDAVVPFRSPYRPIWVGLGALAFDMLLAVAITSGLRRRIGTAVWRGVHWLAYACWPIAAVHGLGSGSDARLPGALLVFVLCISAVAGTIAWRLALGPLPSTAWRLGGGATAALVVIGIAVFALAGPLQPGWSRRSGTSSALLAQLSGSAATSFSSTSTPGTSPPVRSTGIPAAPFSTTVSGTVTTSPVAVRNDTQVTLNMRLADTMTPLQVRIEGPAVDGGVELRQSSVVFGPLSGTVTALEGSTIGAVVGGTGGTIDLTLTLVLVPDSGTLSGGLSASHTA